MVELYLAVVGRKAEQGLPSKISSKFPRSYRLASKHDFQSVFAKSRKISRRFFTVLYQSNQQLHPRLGIVISKSRVSRAVDRNRIRRLIRESFRTYKDVVKELDIVILIRSKCSPQDNKALKDEIDGVWSSLIKS